MAYRVFKEEDEFFFHRLGKKVATLDTAIDTIKKDYSKRGNVDDLVVVTDPTTVERLQFDENHPIVAVVYEEGTRWRNFTITKDLNVDELTTDMSPSYYIVNVEIDL